VRESVCKCVSNFFGTRARERLFIGFPSLSLSLSSAKCTSFDHFWRERFSCGHKRAKTPEAQKTKQARDDALVKSTSLFPRLKHDDVCGAFQQNLGDARVRGQETTTKFARRPRDDHQSGRERLAENNRRKRRRDEEISVERSPTGGYSRHV